MLSPYMTGLSLVFCSFCWINAEGSTTVGAAVEFHFNFVLTPSGISCPCMIQALQNNTTLGIYYQIHIILLLQAQGCLRYTTPPFQTA